MLGESMMVCPVTTKGAQTRVVYLPKGTWTDYWTGKPYEGKQYLSVLCPIEQVPIFIKVGAIIPTQEVLEYIGEKEVHSLTVDIYPSEKSSFTLYDDDGKSLDYQQGGYATTPIEVTKGSTESRVRIEPSQGDYKIPDRSYELNIRMAHTPKSVKVNHISYKIGGSAGKANTAFFEKGILTLSVPSNSQGIDVLVIK